MIANKSFLESINPHALERLYLVNTLYESSKILKEESLVAVKLIYTILESGN